MTRHPIRDRLPALALLAVLAVVIPLVHLLSPDPVHAGDYVWALVGGMAIALHAVGIIIVYRANRIINFAQLSMGLTGAMVFLELVHRRVFIDLLGRVCGRCVNRPETVGDVLALAGRVSPDQVQRVETFFAQQGDQAIAATTRLADIDGLDRTSHELAVDLAPQWALQANYALSAVVAIAVSSALIWLVYALVVRRFTEAPRVVLTVLTLALGAFTHLTASTLLGWFLGAETLNPIRDTSGAAVVPVDVMVALQPQPLRATELFVLVAGLAGLVIFTIAYQRSRTGMVLRAASQNPQRARTLGIPLERVTGRAWIAAGTLSGLAAVLGAAQSGTVPANAAAQVRVLGAAVVGGLTQLPLTIAGAFSIGGIDRFVQRAAGSAAITSMLLVGLIALLLLAQRSRTGRAEREEEIAWAAARELRPIPTELRRLPEVRRTTLVLAFLATVIVVGYPWFMSPGQTNRGIVTLVYAIVGMSLLVLTGWAGRISLGQMAFAAVGAWIAAVSGLPLVLALLVGAAAGAGVAVLVGLPALRLPGQYLAVVTLALGVAASSLLLGQRELGRYLPGTIERPMLLGVDFDDERAFYYLTLVVTALVVAATMGMRRSRTARALIASRDNPAAAEAMGINLLRARLAAFGVSGGMAAVAGVMLVYAQTAVPQESYSADIGIEVFLVTLIGGLGSVAGPIAGALYFGVLDLIRGTAFAQLGNLLLHPGLGVVVVLLVLPGGVIQGVYKLRDMWLRKLADRHRIVVPSLIADRAGEVAGRVPIQPKLRPGGGGTQFIPVRYRLPAQWALEARRRDVEDREQAHV